MLSSTSTSISSSSCIVVATAINDNKWTTGLATDIYAMIFSGLRPSELYVDIERVCKGWQQMSCNGCGWPDTYLDNRLPLSLLSEDEIADRMRKPWLYCAIFIQFNHNTHKLARRLSKVKSANVVSHYTISLDLPGTWEAHRAPAQQVMHLMPGIQHLQTDYLLFGAMMNSKNWIWSSLKTLLIYKSPGDNTYGQRVYLQSAIAIQSGSMRSLTSLIIHVDAPDITEHLLMNVLPACGTSLEHLAFRPDGVVFTPKLEQALAVCYSTLTSLDISGINDPQNERTTTRFLYPLFEKLATRVPNINTLVLSIPSAEFKHGLHILIKSTMLRNSMHHIKFVGDCDRLSNDDLKNIQKAWPKLETLDLRQVDTTFDIDTDPPHDFYNGVEVIQAATFERS